VARHVAWVAPGKLHLTLKFLGNVDQARVEEIVAALRGAAAGVAAFEAAVRGLGAFPTPTRPRVIWAGVSEGADTMVELAGRVDTALAILGFPREARPFSPHVTLGRVRVPRRDPALAEALAGGEGREFGRVRVGRVALMQSRLSPKGSEYTELAGVPLR
jgi:2'-5' RNA ligase